MRFSGAVAEEGVTAIRFTPDGASGDDELFAVSGRRRSLESERRHPFLARRGWGPSQSLRRTHGFGRHFAGRLVAGRHPICFWDL